MHLYYVYVLASQSRNLYIGLTSTLHRRLEQHRGGRVAFTARYRIDRLVHVESTRDVRAAIRREKQLKGWTRARKLALIEQHNPAWDDLLPPSC